MSQKSILVAVVSFCVGALPALGQEHGAMNPEEMMKEWAKWSNPSSHHKHLEKFVGKWNTTVKMWMDPSAPATESKGTAEFRMLLGGRWLEERYAGEFMGQPFEGIGMVGYDNFKQVYVNSWADNVSTALMTSSGTSNAQGTEISLSGTMDDPMTGEKNKKFREVMRWTGADQFVFEMYDNISGKEVKVMEITHTRQK